MSLSKIEKFLFFESGNDVKATRRLPQASSLFTKTVALSISTVKELFHIKNRKPLKTKAFGVVGWRPREDLNLRPHA